MIRVGIIEVGQAEDATIERYGTYSQMIEGYFAQQPNITFSSFDAVKDESSLSPRVCDAWIIPGSRYSAYEDKPWLPPLREFVQETIMLTIPVLGICFGHQLMAQAMGGVVEKSAKGKAIGIHAYSLTEAGQRLIPGKSELNLIAAYEDQVVIPPPNAILLAESPFCAFAGFAYGQAGLSLQGHPEFSVAYERDLIEGWNRRSPMAQSLIDTAMETLNTIRPDLELVAPILANFLTRQRTL